MIWGSEGLLTGSRACCPEKHCARLPVGASERAKKRGRASALRHPLGTTVEAAALILFGAALLWLAGWLAGATTGSRTVLFCPLSCPVGPLMISGARTGNWHWRQGYGGRSSWCSDGRGIREETKESSWTSRTLDQPNPTQPNLAVATGTERSSRDTLLPLDALYFSQTCCMYGTWTLVLLRSQWHSRNF